MVRKLSIRQNIVQHKGGFPITRQIKNSKIVGPHKSKQDDGIAGKYHTKNEHRFHGKGAFDRTHRLTA